MSSRLDRIPACDRQTDRQLDRRTGWQTDGQTDRQTSCHGIVRAMHTRRAVKRVKLQQNGYSCYGEMLWLLWLRNHGFWFWYESV